MTEGRGLKAKQGRMTQWGGLTICIAKYSLAADIFIRFFFLRTIMHYNDNYNDNNNNKKKKFRNKNNCIVNNDDNDVIRLSL